MKSLVIEKKYKYIEKKYFKSLENYKFFVFY